MSIKNSILKVLPKTLQQPIRRIYYFRLVKFFKNTPELNFISTLVKSGAGAIDIGANVGVYTKCLSELVGSEGEVISIEPIPTTFDILRYNIKKLKLNNVKLFNYAISDFDGDVSMLVPSWSTGGDNFYEAAIVDGNVNNEKAISIKSRKLDTLTGVEHHKIGFIKIDVEGHELKVIRGGLNTIRSNMPIMLIEIKTDPEDSSSEAAEIFNLLKGLGYGIFFLDGMQLKEYYSGLKNIDYFFVPNSKTI